uniref:Uncharacterized protein n=1 Tax=Anguilla anguilla TaxID=7936 RepID=A0A0E9TJ94_ANGAN
MNSTVATDIPNCNRATEILSTSWHHLQSEA